MLKIRRIHAGLLIFLFMLFPTACDRGSVKDAPLAVSATYPASGATNFAVNAIITVTFSEAIDPATVNASTFLISGVTGTVACDGATATFKPSGSLGFNTTYTATLTTEIKYLAGNALSSDNTWTFTTAAAAVNGDALDFTFNGRGYVNHGDLLGAYGANDEGNAIALDSSGRILVTGYGWNYHASDAVDPFLVPSTAMVIWRFNPDGTLDRTFNSKGYVTHHGAAGGDLGDVGFAIAVDTVGRIVVAGASNKSNYNYDLAVWRFNSDGSLDTTFNGIGYVVHDNAAGGNSGDVGLDLAIDSLGRIVVVGVSNGPNEIPYMTVWRYNDDGTLDTTFNGTGFLTHKGAEAGTRGSHGNAIALDASEKIVVVGDSDARYLTIWRFNPDGTMDPAFNTIGYVINDKADGINSGGSGNDLVFDPLGNMLIAGISGNTNNNADMTIWKYHPDGTLDTMFNGAGCVVHDNAAGGNSHDRGEAIALDRLGRVLAAGYSYNSLGYSPDMAIWRFNADGTLDTTFNGRGYLTHRISVAGNYEDIANEIILDSSGRVLVAGKGTAWGGEESSSDMVIWRFK